MSFSNVFNPRINRMPLVSHLIDIKTLDVIGYEYVLDGVTFSFRLGEEDKLKQSLALLELRFKNEEEAFEEQSLADYFRKIESQ